MVTFTTEESIDIEIVEPIVIFTSQCGIQKGNPGISAYQSYANTTLDDPVLSEADWILAMQGTDGINGLDGIDGVDGLSAYEIAVLNGYTGTEEEWLNSMTPTENNLTTVTRTELTGTNLATDLDIINSRLKNSILNSVIFNSEFDNENITGTKTINWINGQNQKCTLIGDCEITMTPLNAASTFRVQIKVIQDAIGGRNVTFSDTVINPKEFDFSEGTAGQECIVTFYYDGSKYIMLSTPYYDIP